MRLLRLAGARRTAAGAIVAAVLLAGITAFQSPYDRRLPRIVFVSRHAAEGGAIPGLGPSGRTLAPGGELLIRERSGRVRALLPSGTFHDVADPAVSYDGTRIAFAAVRAPGDAWRIFSVNADGEDLRQVTHDPAATGAKSNDFDPCFMPDGRIVFASTRLDQISQRGGYPVSNLFAIEPDGSNLIRLTTERNGAEAPSIDPRDGRIVYARWWFNRWRATNALPGVTLEPDLALEADDVDFWHAVSIHTDGDGVRLAGGDPRERSGQMAYDPAILEDGTLIGVQAEESALAGPPGRTWLVRYDGGFAVREVLGEGPALDPVPLADGRLLCAIDPAGVGDFALYVLHPDRPELARRVYDRPGTLEMDAAVLAPRPLPPVLRPGNLEPPPDPAVTDIARLTDHVNTFRFDCLNVFATGGVDSRFPDAPPLQQGVKIRFFATLSRPEAAGGDTVVLVGESDVTAAGAVHVDEMPADVPMFEQLVDAKGRILRSAMGPAHVPGLNFARMGTGTKCVGCHAGHSALTVPINYTSATWVNAAPSAVVSASSVAAGAAAPRAAVDRMTLGPAAEVAWQAAGAEDEWLRLEWGTPIEVRAIVLYACRADRAERTDLRVDQAEIRMFRDGREVGRVRHDRRLRAEGSRLEVDPAVIDALEFRPLRTTGLVRGRRSAALAEIEVDARLAYDKTAP